MSTAWRSLHIHYNSDPFWLLTEVLFPLINTEAAQLVSKYFFVRYWERGPHVRLRLMPASADQAPRIIDLAKSRLTDFFRKRPSVFAFPGKEMPSLFRDIFLEEYGARALHDKYGASGIIPYESNNTVVEASYEPEYERYGGPSGIAVAEAYFQRSSDITFRVLTGPNGHDFRIVLGHALRFLIYVCSIFFPASARATFCKRYETRWAAFRQKTGAVPQADFSHKYARQSGEIRCAIDAAASFVDRQSSAPDVDMQCLRVLEQTKADLDATLLDGSLIPSPGTMSPADFRDALLISYVHMHNNRLGLAISDEVYVAAMAAKGFDDAY